MKKQILLVLLMALINAGAAQVTFEDLAGMSDRDRARLLRDVTGSGENYAGIKWDPAWWVAGDAFIARQDPSDLFNADATAPFARPHSGHFAIFNGFGTDGLRIDTSQYLTGAWFARPRLADDPGGATRVTVSAVSNVTILSSVSLDLTNATPLFMDTSRFLSVTGITHYVLSRKEGSGQSDNGYFIVDDFEFHAVKPKTSRKQPR